MKNVIAQIRKEKKISQTQLASDANISRGHLSGIENDKVEPTGKVLYQIAKVLNTTVDSLFLP